MPDRGSFDAGAHLEFRWHTYPKGEGMRRLDGTDVAWWSDAGALVGIELPNLAAAGTAHQGVTLGTPAFFDADTTSERSAVLLDGTNDSISIGAAPYAEGYFDFRAAEDHLVNIPTHTNYNPTGDVTLIVKLSAGDWTPGSVQTLYSHWLPPSNKSMLLQLNGSGKLVYKWSTDGSNEFQLTSASAVIPPTNGDLWIAVAHDVNNGSGGNTLRFLTSSNFSEPTTMNVLSTHTDPSTVTSYYASSVAPIRLGSRDANQDRLYGRFKTAILRGSIVAGNIGLTNELFRIDADAIYDETASSIPLAVPAGQSAVITGNILKGPDGANGCFGPEESSTVILVGFVEATQPSVARLFDSQPASLMGGQAIHVTGTSGAALTSRVARAGVGTETTVAETASTSVPEAMVLRVDRQLALQKFWTKTGGESTVAIDPLQGSSQRYADIRIGSANENAQYANFDFYAGAILRTAISDADRTLITEMFLNGSDTYDDGDFWTVTTPGIFDGVFYLPGDQVLATGGQNMEFDAVTWARVPADQVPGPPPLPVDRTVFGIVEKNGPPSELEASFFEDPVTYPYRRLDILNSDNSLWFENAPLISGAVNIDYDRDERRSGDCEIWLPDTRIGPGSLWYDKVFKFYRGITFSPYHRDPNYAGATLVWQIGSFIADRISESSESANFKVTFRDLTKRMMLSKTTEAITFPEGEDIAVIIRALAANSGIFDMLVPITGKQIGKDFTFEAGTSRWEIAKKIATDFGYELFFDHRGWLVMRPFVDPLTSPIYLNLVARRGGLGADGRKSNVASYDRSASDERIYNHVVVIGEGTDRTVVYRAEAENTLPNSPTSIARIGRRTYLYTSSFITTQEQAQETADALLKINALEQFEINVGTIVYPWVEVGTTIKFDDDDPFDGFPSRYLLKTATIPLGLAQMSLGGSRVTIVGEEIPPPAPVTYTMGADGFGLFTGQASIVKSGPGATNRVITASGSGTSGGSGVVGLRFPFAAAGSGQTAGNAGMNAKGVFTAQGTGAFGGQAGLNIKLPYAAVGAGTTNGVAQMTVGQLANGYIDFPGTSGNYLDTPDATAFNIPGDLCVAVRVAPTDWTPSVQQTFISQYNSAVSQRSWELVLDTTGAILFRWSSDGVSVAGTTGGLVTSSTVLSTRNPHEWLWIMACHDVNDNAGGNRVKIYWSSDNVNTADEVTTWNSIADVTNAFVTSHYNPTLPLILGAINDGGSRQYNGYMSSATVRNGIGAGATFGGTQVFGLHPNDIVADTATSFTSISNHTVTVHRTGTPDVVLVPSTQGGISNDLVFGGVFPIGVFLQDATSSTVRNTWYNRFVNTFVMHSSTMSTDPTSWSNAIENDGRFWQIRPPKGTVSGTVEGKFTAFTEVGTPTSLLAYCQQDEVDLVSNQCTYQTVQENYALFKTNRPDVPVFITTTGTMNQNDIRYYPSNDPADGAASSGASWMNKYWSGSDFFGADRYPVHAGAAFSVFTDMCDRLNTWPTAGNADKPWLVYIECSDQDNGTGQPAPTPAQVRGHIWAAICKGARGYIFFPQNVIGTYVADNTPSDVATEITTQNNRVAQIGAILQGEINPAGVSVSTSNSGLLKAWRNDGTYLYYIVHNYTASAVNGVTVTLTGHGSATTAEVMFESRNETIASNAFVDDFPAYSYHVYRVAL